MWGSVNLRHFPPYGSAREQELPLCYKRPYRHKKNKTKNLWTSDLHGKCNAQAHMRNTHSLKLIRETDMLWLFKPKLLNGSLCMPMCWTTNLIRELWLRITPYSNRYET